MSPEGGANIYKFNARSSRRKAFKSSFILQVSMPGTFWNQQIEIFLRGRSRIHHKQIYWKKCKIKFLWRWHMLKVYLFSKCQFMGYFIPIYISCVGRNSRNIILGLWNVSKKQQMFEYIREKCNIIIKWV